jgi:hypothetical protein
MSAAAAVAVQQCSNAMTQYRSVSTFKSEGCGHAGSDITACYNLFFAIIFMYL